MHAGRSAGDHAHHLTTFLLGTMIPSVEQFRDGLFALRTHRFGKVPELLIKRMVNLGKGKSRYHDLYDDVEKRRVEVKFSTVQSSHNLDLDETTVLDCVVQALTPNRAVTRAGWAAASFNCNFSQIKPAEFDILYYGLFFYDKIAIFRVGSEIVSSVPYYSTKQHKNGKDEAQFQITQKNLETHFDKFAWMELDYREMLDLLHD